MEIKLLVYIGNKQKGTITVRQVPANSEWRRLPFRVGMRLRVGTEIPADVAQFVVDNFRKLFKFESAELPPEQYFTEKFMELYDTVKEDGLSFKDFLETLDPLVSKLHRSARILKATDNDELFKFQQSTLMERYGEKVSKKVAEKKYSLSEPKGDFTRKSK
jgi:hypothetical protein